jgi:hypothetical protein
VVSGEWRVVSGEWRVYSFIPSIYMNSSSVLGSGFWGAPSYRLLIKRPYLFF